jgi:hypothetical protein
VLEQYGLKKWQVKYVSRFSSQMFSYRYVILPAANTRRTPRNFDSKRILSRLSHAQRLWFNMAKALIVRRLWVPTPEFNSLITQHATIKRCLYCRPTNVVFYWPRNEPDLKLCNRKSICPFCAAREAEELYRRVSKVICKQRELNVKAKVFYRCETYTLKARNFDGIDWGNEQIADHAEELRQLLRHERKKYRQIAGQLKKSTLGSFWRIVVNPIAIGWEIQIRQFFIVTPKAKRPVNRAKKSAAIFLQSAPAHEFKAVMKLLGQFVAYPSGMLTAYAEFTAVFLNARRNLRLISGTGCLYAKNRKRKPAQEQPPPLPFIP